MRSFVDTNVLVYAVDESAISAGCDVLLTEDLQDGRRYGRVLVSDPFR